MPKNSLRDKLAGQTTDGSIEISDERTPSAIGKRAFEQVDDEESRARPDYGPIVERAAKRTKRPFGLSERVWLAMSIKSAILAYRGSQFEADKASQFTLHKIEKPLASVIETIEQDANIDAILVCLGAPETLMMSPDKESVFDAAARYRSLLYDLRELARKLPPPSTKRIRPPAKRKRLPVRDLEQLVDWLADGWVQWTGEDFTQAWHRGQPIADAARFVHAVINVVDPKRLGSLPKVTARIVARRRKANRTISQKLRGPDKI